MHELTALIQTYQTLRQSGDKAAIATVVKTSGSTYRRPGARFLLASDGRSVGMVSGGCLENAVRDHAEQVLASGKPTLVTYDGASPDDIVWGMGLGCNGVVHALIEPVDPRHSSYLDFIAECLERRQYGVLATVFTAQEAAQIPIGTHLMMDAEGRIIFASEALMGSQAIIEAAQMVLAEQRSVVKTFTTENGKIEVLLEIITPPTPLIIFGAGPDAVPLSQLAKGLGWHVTVVDHRPAYAKQAHFIMADQVILSRPELVTERMALDNRTVAVIMTHHYMTDRVLLETLLASPVCYLGALGPRNRTQRLLQEIQEAGMTTLSDDRLKHLYGPVGLDIGAETPEEVALAIIAEIQAVLTQRSGVSLRHRADSIHSK
jgi:xanthine/CO dehydrogenase XdhC/CoxF family maturation factor